MMTKVTRHEAADWLANHDNYCILTHCRPDGDTIGSAAALCLGLRKIGKTAVILENPEITPRFIPYYQSLAVSYVPEGAHLVTVDVASPKMLPKNARSLADSIALRIDHHGAATPFSELELVDPDAGACGEIIFDVLAALSIALDASLGEALYVAISTDTGCFRYANTTAHTFSVAAACAAAGADLFAVNLVFFETHRLAKLRLQGWIAANTQFLADGRLAICVIPKAVEQELGVNEDDMDNISGFPRTIEGVRMSATLRQPSDTQTRVSIRAVPGYDAGAICAKFGGGGHKGAAGAMLSLPLEEAAAVVGNAMLEAEAAP